MKWSNALVIIVLLMLMGWLANLVVSCARYDKDQLIKESQSWKQFKVDHHCHLDLEHQTWNFIWHCDGFDVIHNGN